MDFNIKLESVCSRLTPIKAKGKLSKELSIFEITDTVTPKTVEAGETLDIWQYYIDKGTEVDRDSALIIKSMPGDSFIITKSNKKWQFQVPLMKEGNPGGGQDYGDPVNVEIGDVRP
jgi:hypothetical protein